MSTIISELKAKKRNGYFNMNDVTEYIFIPSLATKKLRIKYGIPVRKLW